MVKVFIGLAVLIFIAISFCAKAQLMGGQYTDAKEIRFSGSVVDSINKEPLSGAVIHLVTKTLNGELQTRSLITDKNGKFDFKTENYCQTRAEISFLGYKIRSFVLPKYQETFNLGKIEMIPDLFNLEEVTIKARRKMYERLGDTVRIYSKAVKTLQGDVIIEILWQIPGIEILPDGSVSMDGKLIERTYINDKLIFGDDKVTALYVMNAKDATNIDIYDEEDKEDHTSLKKRRHKVMNIHTEKDFDAYTAADILLEGGEDRVKNKEGCYEKRYSTGGGLGFFNEKRQARILAEKSNIRGGAGLLNSPSRYNNLLLNDAPLRECFSVTTELNLKQKNNNSYRFYYSFHRDETYVLNEASNVFFPTDYFKSQIINTTNAAIIYSEKDRKKIQGIF